MILHRSSRPSIRRRRSRLCPLAAALLLALGMPAAQAATITVDTDADGSVADHCTLRDAVAAANTDLAVAGCTAGSGADAIHFVPDVASITLTAASGGSLLVSSELSLDGQGRPVTVRRDPADTTFRIVETHDTGPLVLRWMRITGGRLDEQDMYRGGAGVLSRADLTLESSEVSSNVTNKLWGRGAGVLAHAGLTLVDSVVSGNASTGSESSGGGLYSYYQPVSLMRSVVSGNATLGTASPGGGIGTRPGVDVVATASTIADNWTGGAGSFGGAVHAPIATLTLVDSTVSGNSTEGDNAWAGGVYAYTVHASASTVSGNWTVGYASYGGGLVTVAADISNSTVSGNSTAGVGALGGGLVVVSASSLRNSTIFGNRAEQATGGGIAVWGSDPATVVTLDSSLVAGNEAQADADVAFFNVTGEGGEIGIAGGHNLIGAPSASAVFPADTLSCDPRLQPLAANGGRTMTHRLGDGSCAIDAGANPDALASDQRGADYARTSGAATDIGAVERQPADEKIFADGFDLP
jgi:hypothetical protein